MQKQIIIKTFEELSKTELYQLLKIRQEVFVVEQECAYLDIDNLDQHTIHLMLFIETDLCAYARVIPPGIQDAHFTIIGRVLVDKKCRKRNLGHEIMQAAIDQARLKWPTPIKISAQSYTLPFYRALGFKIRGEPYLEDGIPHQAMILSHSMPHE